MSIIWPFPGTDEPHGPPKPLPPTRFAIGDRVTTCWGSATVIAISDWAYDDGRAILVKHDWSSAPPGFGHSFSDADIEPLVEQPAEDEDGGACQLDTVPGRQRECCGTRVGAPHANDCTSCPAQVELF